MSLYGGDPNIGQQMTDAQTKQDETERLGLDKINATFKGFDQNFYDARAKAYENYAMPQLQRDYGQEKNAVSFGLANRGLTGSSAARSTFSDLGKTMVQKEQDIANQGQSLANQLKQQINSAKTNLISELSASTTPGAASQQALAAASAFTAPSPFAPIGPQFGDVNAALMMRQAIANPGGGGAAQPYMSNPSGTQYDAPSAPLPNTSYEVA